MRPPPSRWCSILSAAASVAAAYLLSGCEIHIAEEEIQARRASAEDALDVLFIYRGITASKPDAKTLAEAVGTAEKVLSGRRIFMIGGWLFAPDLDDAAQSLAAPDDGKPGAGDVEAYLGDPDRRKELVDLLRGCTLEERGGFLDDQKRLSAYQVFRFRRVSRIVEIANTCISLAVLEAMRKGEFDRGRLLDDRSRELWKQHAESRKPWFRIDGGELVIEIPITTASYDSLARQLIDDLATSEGERPGADASAQLILLAQVLGHVRRFEVEDQRAVLRLGAPGGGNWRLSFVDPKPLYDSRLLDALRAKGIEPDPKVTLEEVRRKLASRSEGAKPGVGESRDG